MDFWTRFFGPKIAPPVHAVVIPVTPLPEKLNGHGAFGLALVGESHYQANLAHAAGGRRPQGVDGVTAATLVLEDANRADRNAVRVDILGRPVGYLTRDKAKKYRRLLADLGHAGAQCTCQARIVCGPDRGDGVTRSFGVWLDVNLSKRSRA